MLAEGWISRGVASAVLIGGAYLSLSVSVWLTVFLSLSSLFPLRPFVSGVLYLSSPGNLHLELGEKGLGFGLRRAEWWLPLDEISGLRENRWGTTSIRHISGTCVDFPTGLLEEDDIAVLRDAIDSYRARH
jgi:hypothetical protein